MNHYKYSAMKKDGTKIEGEFEALSKDAVMSMISSNGLYPLKIEEVIQSKNIEIKRKKKVTAKDLSVFCRQMYTMLNAGVPVTNAFGIIKDQISNASLRTAIEDIDSEVKRGEMISDAMKKHRDVFPNLLISMIESGEMSGNLDEMMDRLAVNFEKDSKINGKVKSAMIYPIALGIVAVVVVAAIMLFVLPTFIEMFEKNGQELPGITKALISVSEFLSNNIFIILAIIIGGSIWFSYFKKTEKGQYFVSNALLKMPIMGPLTQKIIVSRFTRTLSTLMASGVSLIHALPIVGSVVGNKVAEDAVQTIRERVSRGDGLSDPIKKIDIFPPMLSAMVRIGEESGSLDDILTKTADFYDDEVEEQIQIATSMIEPIMIVTMGLVIGFIIVAIMAAMFSSYSNY